MVSSTSLGWRTETGAGGRVPGATGFQTGGLGGAVPADAGAGVPVKLLLTAAALFFLPAATGAGGVVLHLVSDSLYTVVYTIQPTVYSVQCTVYGVQHSVFCVHTIVGL